MWTKEVYTSVRVVLGRVVRARLVTGTGCLGAMQESSCEPNPLELRLVDEPKSEQRQGRGTPMNRERM